MWASASVVIAFERSPLPPRMPKTSEIGAILMTSGFDVEDTREKILEALKHDDIGISEPSHVASWKGGKIKNSSGGDRTDAMNELVDAVHAKDNSVLVSQTDKNKFVDAMDCSMAAVPATHQKSLEGLGVIAAPAG